MQATTLPVRKAAQSIGDYISYDYFRYLTDEFTQRHPGEQKLVFIAKEFIMETLEKYPGVSGIRFMYGLKAGDEVSSRTIVLMACNDTSTDKPLPNLILAQGVCLTHSGEIVSLDQCWEMFNRYVSRMCTLMPEEQRKEIPRACFYGISSLKDLLDLKDCAGIMYHFGYNPTTEYLPQRYQTVLEAVNKDRQSLHSYIDHGELCPPNCTPPIIPDEWILGSNVAQYRSTANDNGYELIKHFREFALPEDEAGRALYEMYHNVSPSLIEAIQQPGIEEKSPAEIYKEQFAECRSLVAAGKKEEAKGAFKQGLEEMMAKYLFRN